MQATSNKNTKKGRSSTVAALSNSRGPSLLAITKFNKLQKDKLVHIGIPANAVDGWVHSMVQPKIACLSVSKEMLQEAKHTNPIDIRSISIQQ